MSFTGAYVSLKWFWQQQAFSDSKSPGLPTVLLCPFCVPIIPGLAFLVFFSFPISSDLKPGRITSTCLSAISTLTLSFWMRIARPRDSLQVLHDDRIKHLVLAILFPLCFFYLNEIIFIYLYTLYTERQRNRNRCRSARSLFCRLFAGYFH